MCVAGFENQILFLFPFLPNEDQLPAQRHVNEKKCRNKPWFRCSLGRLSLSQHPGGRCGGHEVLGRPHLLPAKLRTASQSHSPCRRRPQGPAAGKTACASRARGTASRRGSPAAAFPAAFLLSPFDGYFQIKARPLPVTGNAGCTPSSMAGVPLKAPL